MDVSARSSVGTSPALTFQVGNRELIAFHFAGLVKPEFGFSENV
jgi:hypothetical protein